MTLVGSQVRGLVSNAIPKGMNPEAVNDVLAEHEFTVTFIVRGDEVETLLPGIVFESPPTRVILGDVLEGEIGRHENYTDPNTGKEVRPDGLFDETPEEKRGRELLAQDELEEQRRNALRHPEGLDTDDKDVENKAVRTPASRNTPANPPANSPAKP